LATGLVDAVVGIPADVRLDVGFELHDPRSDVERVRTPHSERQACDPDEAAQR
jgi:hypothetical protein